MAIEQPINSATTAQAPNTILPSVPPKGKVKESTEWIKKTVAGLGAPKAVNDAVKYLCDTVENSYVPKSSENKDDVSATGVAPKAVDNADGANS